MSKTKLLAGVGLMVLGTVCFITSAGFLFRVLDTSLRGPFDRLLDIGCWLGFGAMTTWLAVIASGQDGDTA